jgi:hypothetical protein
MVLVPIWAKESNLRHGDHKKDYLELGRSVGLRARNAADSSAQKYHEAVLGTLIPRSRPSQGSIVLKSKSAGALP